MKDYQVAGYCRVTGQKRTIVVQASTSRHAKTLAYDKLRYPRIEGRKP